MGDIERAETQGRKRAAAGMASGGVYLVSLWLSLQHDGTRSVDYTYLAAWTLWTVVLLVILAGGGGMFSGARVRRLMNDDVTRDHRSAALAWGFWTAIAAAVLCYAIDLFEPMAGHRAARIVITFSVGVALLRFGRLELRAYRDA